MVEYAIKDIDLFYDFKIDENLKYRWYGEKRDILYEDINGQQQQVEMIFCLYPFKGVIYNNRMYVLYEDEVRQTDDQNFVFIYSETNIADSIDPKLVYSIGIRING